MVLIIIIYNNNNIIIIMIIIIIIMIIIIIIIIIITKYFVTHTPAGAESDLKRYGERRLARRKSPVLTAQTTRPLQKEERRRNGRVASFGESPSDTHSRSDSTIHYGVTAIL